MDYSKKFENCYFFNDSLGLWSISENAQYLSIDDWCDLVDYVDSLNQKIIDCLHSSIKNVSTADVVLSKNKNRKFDKSNVCLRVTNNLIEDYEKFSGQLDVPVQDLMLYVLEYGLTHYRVIKEI